MHLTNKLLFTAIFSYDCNNINAMYNPQFVRCFYSHMYVWKSDKCWEPVKLSGCQVARFSSLILETNVNCQVTCDKFQMSNAYGVPWDMLNNFCFHVYAHKSLIIGENGHGFWDILHVNRVCDIRVHRAGSQLKMECSFQPFINKTPVSWWHVNWSFRDNVCCNLILLLYKIPPARGTEVDYLILNRSAGLAHQIRLKIGQVSPVWIIFWI